MMRTFRLAIFLLGAFIVASACDSTETENAESVDPLLAAQQGELALSAALQTSMETRVDELSEAAFLDFCSISLSVMREYRERRTDPRYSCVGEGLYAIYGPTSEESDETCEEARDACYAVSSDYIPPPPITCDETYLPQAASCTITIGQYEDCVAGIDDTMLHIDATLSCDASLEQAMEMQALYTATAPPICDVLASDCSLLAESLP